MYSCLKSDAEQEWKENNSIVSLGSKSKFIQEEQKKTDLTLEVLKQEITVETAHRKKTRQKQSHTPARATPQADSVPFRKDLKC